VAMVVMGLAYSLLASALWPMVSLVVPDYQLGTAYGIMQAVQNLGLAVITSVAGYIVDSLGYLLLEVFFLAWLCLSLACTILLWLRDSSHTGVLNMSVEQRDAWDHHRMLSESLERDQMYTTAVRTVVPRSDFLIRNRYLSRIGARLPASYDPSVRGIVYRTLR